MYSPSLFTWISAVIACVLGFLYWIYQSRNDDYWKKRGIPYTPRMNIFHAVWTIRNKNLNELVLESGKIFDDRGICGGFEGSKPILTVADPDLLRDILVKDFHVFANRRDIKTGDPVSDSMVSLLKGEDWKRVRTIITPAFTSKRMRQISSIINECSNSIANAVEENSKTGNAVDFKGLFGAFTMDVIASSAFGTKIDPYSDPNNVFVQRAKENFISVSSWRLLLFLIFPLWILRYLSFSTFTSRNFFKEVVTEVIKTRKEQKKRYNDVLQILMDAADEQALLENSELNVDEKDRYGSIINNALQPHLKYKTLSQNEVLAQCVLFFVVGYETSATTLTFMAYSLATNPEWQEKLIAEVDESFKKNSKMSYDAVRGMKVLDAVISETLRMYPPLLMSERAAGADYKLGDTGLTVEKGTNVLFPIYYLHFNPKYFEEPNKFNPERFLDSSQSTFHEYAYLPFGAGPRNCLGMRFALLEIKLCITNMLRRYRFRPHSSTKIPVEFRKASAFLTVNEMPLVVEKRMDA